MLRKTLIMTIFIFLFTICFAPLPDPGMRDLQRENFIKELKRIEREKEFNRLMTDIGERESNQDWRVINKIGCIGKYQFHINTLHKIGYVEINLTNFRKDPGIFPPEMQDEAFMALVELNERALKEFDAYLGQSIKGVLITKSGLIAAAHLGGIRSVWLFLTTKNRNPKDIFGTSIKDYMRDFAGYKI
jgi:hypothetical protein